MEECSEASMFSNDEEIVCPGPLFRVKMFVMGEEGSGKAKLIQALLGSSVTQPDQSTEAVSVSIWYPFKNSKTNCELVSKKLTGEDHHLIIEMWNMSGSQMFQGVYPICLTASAICVVVYNTSAETNKERFFSLFKTIQQKTPRNPVFLVEMQSEAVDGNKTTSLSGREILSDLKKCAESRKLTIQNEIEKLRLLSRELKTKHLGVENSSKQKNTPQEKDTSEKTDSMILQEINALEASLKNKTKIPTRIYKVKQSNRKGLDELKSAILDTALNRVVFPHLDRTIKQSTITLYDEILKLREKEVTLLTWKEFQELKVKDNENNGDDTLEEETTFLQTVGGVLDFNPRPSSLHTCKSKSTLPSSESSRFICVHPSVLANAMCSCLIDDDKKAFRFESCQFWPKDSGFKRPDPCVLGRVLEMIPQKGLIRESLFPLLWQNQNLDEQQVLYTLDLLKSLGVLVPYLTSKDNCEGLALPYYPRLSVQQCHCATLLDLLPDNRPQLNWTLKPFKGDIQITWRFTFPNGLPASTAKRFLGHCYCVGKNNSYSYLWKYGALLRLGEVFICTEHADDQIDVSCRVNADEPGQVDTSVQLLWVTLALFIQAAHGFLHRECPGLFYNECIVAMGQQFYCDENVETEPVIQVVRALAFWKAAKRFIFKDGEVEKELDMDLFFPFRGNDLDVSSVENWLMFVASRRKQVLESLLPNVAASSVGFKKSLSPFISLKASMKLKRKKQKSADIKWKLGETATVVSKPTANTESDDKNKMPPDQHVTKTGAGDSIAQTTMNDKEITPTVTASGRVLTDEEEMREVSRKASAFVAAVMAGAVADYIQSECENNHSYRDSVSVAQIAAAKVAAEAAMATQSGDIDGAANAVIQAVRAVGLPPTVLKKGPSIGQIPIRSSTCTIL